MLYLDCIGGIAGDMLLSALVDAGADPDRLLEGLRDLAPEGLQLERSRVERHGIMATHVHPVAPDSRQSRTWTEIRETLESAKLPPRARQRAHDTFALLAEAEAGVHGIAAEEVHFHEVGALDAIVDIAGVALALEFLQVDQVVCSPLPAPRGFVQSAHGRLPLPAPAALQLMLGAPVVGVDCEFELVTPTGAALVRSLASEFGALPAMRLTAIGYGSGSREIAAFPNLLRVVLGENGQDAARRPLSLLEANLDDLPPELVPDAVQGCFEANALDVWTVPVQMKKGRTGVILSALVARGDEDRVARTMLRTTSSLGVRVTAASRVELSRGHRTAEVFGEQVRIKEGRLDGELVNLSPEHDDCRAVAGRTGRTVKEVWFAAIAAAGGKLGPD